jgi:hypothetical protein
MLEKVCVEKSFATLDYAISSVGWPSCASRVSRDGGAIDDANKRIACVMNWKLALKTAIFSEKCLYLFVHREHND